MNDLDTEDKLVLKDKYEMELATNIILTNNLAAAILTKRKLVIMILKLLKQI